MGAKREALAPGQGQLGRPAGREQRPVSADFSSLHGPRMISGAHVIIYSKDAEADRTFFRNVLKFPHIDAGDRWLIFALPPSEVAVHPSEENDEHQLFLTCPDLDTTIRELTAKGVSCTKPTEHQWGTLTSIALPGGGKLGLYQPKHPAAHDAAHDAAPAARRASGRPKRSR